MKGLPMKKFSIIMPTLNSEKTIEHALKSIREQEYDQELIEILVVDGGSSDCTLSIAQKYNAKILHNKKKLPEIAKEIGFVNATGKYAMYMDSDEVFINRKALFFREKIFIEFPNVKNIVSQGMLPSKNANGIVRYSNFIADPFSQFVYRYNGYNRMESMKKKFFYIEEEQFLIFHFVSRKIIPLFDAAMNTFDMKFARQEYYQSPDKSNFIANIFANMVSKTNCVAMVKNDQIYHIPELTFTTYLKKLTWRIKNNLFPKENVGIGFSARENIGEGHKVRKIFFVMYAVTLFCPIIDSIKFTLKNKDIIFLLHFFFVEYVFIKIIFYLVLKILNINPRIDKTYAK